MSNTISYKSIFNLNIMHHYFLDNGELAFINTKAPEVFSGHNVNNYLHLTPSMATEKRLTSNQLFFKTTTSGATCLVSTKSYTDLTPKVDLSNATLDFLMYVKDPLFGKYTEHSGGIKDIYYFSNHTDGIASLINNKINDLSATAAALNDYKVIEESTQNKDSKYEKIMATLTPKEQVGLFGIVSVKLSTLLNAAKVPTSPKEFKIVFQNKKTNWVYVDKDGTEKERSKQYPFVKRGKIKIIKNGTTDTEIKYRMATPSDQPMSATETKIYI